MNKSILVVDDDRQMRLALKMILGREGYDIAEAGNGYAALQSVAAQESGFAAVLIDLVMPEKGGIETIMALRRKNPDMKIIAMSGGARRGENDALSLARDCGASYTIAKPFEPSAIRDLVRRCLE